MIIKTSMTQNDDFQQLNVPLPADVARRKAAGDLEGAARLIGCCLERDPSPELAARLRVEQLRLERLEEDYPFTRAQALAMVRAEWPDFTEAQFDALVDNGRIDWRYIRGEERYLDRFLPCLRLYPREAPGLRGEETDNTQRDAMLQRMEAEGELTALITLKATLRAKVGVEGKPVQAWLPVPAACPQQSGIEILDATPGARLAPDSAPARTIYWEGVGLNSFEVTYRYRHRAVYTDPLTLPCDPVQPCFDTREQPPHIVFTPYLRDLARQVTQGCATPVEKAWRIYEYVTGNVDYRFQPAYLQLDSIADSCARELRGDCGVMALLFITLCRIAGVPARWQSGLSARPGHVGPHDWAMFYVAPHGWLWADPSFGSSARRNGEQARRRHYFGSLDPWRMVANSAFQAPLTPPDSAYRQDPYDNQLGEMTVNGRGLSAPEMERTVEEVSIQLL